MGSFWKCSCIVLLFVLVGVTSIAFPEDGQVCDVSEKKTTTPPIIDLSSLIDSSATSEARAAVVQSIGDACRRWGFFQVVNHGVGHESIDSFSKAMQDFFHLDTPTKKLVSRTADNSRGFADDELTKQRVDLKELFDVGHVPRPDLAPDDPLNHVLDGYNQWPTNPPNFESAVMDYYNNCASLSASLMAAIAESLGLPESFFDSSLGGNHTSYLRLNWYPIFEANGGTSKGSDATALGVSRHTDAGALTVLLQDTVSALEVYSGTKEDAGDGQWVPVEPVPGAFTINLGDMIQVRCLFLGFMCFSCTSRCTFTLASRNVCCTTYGSLAYLNSCVDLLMHQVWTNGLYAAPEHRVRRSTSAERFSAPFFYNPSYSADVQPMPLTRSVYEAVLKSAGTASAEDAEAISVPEAELESRMKPRYEPISWGYFRRRRFLGDFADHGKDIQIEDYLIE
jgi:isopenicillin N synthase-like dioxygenase